MQRFRNLAIASTIATFLLVTVGGLVRATKSGLGCGTDWPHCHGKLVPSLEARATLIEFSHRAIAGVVVILIVLLVLAAYRNQESRRLRRASIAALTLVLGQAVLGAVVVKLELDAESVVLHLATAMALLAALVYVTIAAFTNGDSASDRRLSRQSAFAAGAVLTLLLVGSYLSGLTDGSVFDDWPLMNGRLVPALTSEAVTTHVVHRYLAALVGVVVLAVVIRSRHLKDRLPAPARFAYIAAAMFAIEIAIGALNVWTNLNEIVVTLHLATGAAIWSSLVAMTVSAHPTLAPATTERRRPASQPALEGTT
jgi:heme a synthase